MNKDYLKGSLITIAILCLFGIVFAVGFHTADEIISGNFNGDYKVKGKFALNNSNSVCDVTNEGGLKYNSTSDKFYGCDGTEWKEISLGVSQSSDLDTVLLLHCDDFSDSSITPHSVNSVGGASISATGKFGSGCSFDGVDDYLRITDSEDFNFATGSWTIDFWFRADTLPSPYYNFLNQYDDDDNLFYIYLHSDNRFQLWMRNAATQFVMSPSAQTWNTDQWYHVAYVKDGDDWYTFKDGVLIGSKTEVYSVPSLNSDFWIGGFANGQTTTNPDFFDGYMDEIRISKGVARWTSDFEVPTGPYS